MSNELTLADHIIGLREISTRIDPGKHAERCREFLNENGVELLDSLEVGGVTASRGPDFSLKVRTCHTCWGEGEGSNRLSEIVTCPICGGLGYVKNGGAL